MMTRISLRHDAGRPFGLEYLIDPETPAMRGVVESIRHWPRLPELVDFALARHGYGDSNGGFGVTYPGDLDEYALHVEGINIPPGHVQVYGSWGTPDGYEYVVSESDYLDVLIGVLAAHGLAVEAERVRGLRRQITKG